MDNLDNDADWLLVLHGNAYTSSGVVIVASNETTHSWPDPRRVDEGERESNKRDRECGALALKGKTTVQHCIGGHVNVLSDYKKMCPLKIHIFFIATSIISLTCRPSFVKITYLQVF